MGFSTTRRQTTRTRHLIGFVTLFLCCCLASSHLVHAADTADKYAIAGSALLLPWYLGVMDVLVQEGVVDPSTTPGAGLSGGAITAMTTCAGVTPKDQFDTWKKALVQCYDDWDIQSGSFPCNGELSEIVHNGLSTFLKNGTNVSDTCSHVGVAFTKVGSTFDNLESTLVSNFSDDQAILTDLISSSFLSCSSMSKPYFVNNGLATVDGGYSTSLDDLCGGTMDEVKDCLRVQVYYPNTTEDGPVCSHQNTTDPTVAVDLLSQCMAAAGGSLNVAAEGPPVPAWANFTEIGDLPTTCPSGPTRFMPPGEADIYPGKYVPLNYSCFEWQCMAYIPYPNKLDDLYSLGQEEARAWVKATAKSTNTTSFATSGSSLLLTFATIIMGILVVI